MGNDFETTFMTNVSFFRLLWMSWVCPVCQRGTCTRVSLKTLRRLLQSMAPQSPVPPLRPTDFPLYNRERVRLPFLDSFPMKTGLHVY